MAHLPNFRVAPALGRGRRRALATGLLVLWGCALWGGAGALEARAEEAPEYAVKAAFLYNFAKFARWPESSFGDDAAPLQFCFAGEAPFGEAMASLAGKHVGERALAVRTVTSPREMLGCHVLFLSADGSPPVQEVLQGFGTRPVLTVSESPGFCEGGGMINFVTRDGKVRFEINPAAAKRAGIQLSAQLLRLARVVTERGGAR